jgi:hypothetical protein
MVSFNSEPTATARWSLAVGSGLNDIVAPAEYSNTANTVYVAVNELVGGVSDAEYGHDRPNTFPNRALAPAG